MDTEKHTSHPERQEVHRFHGTIGLGHIPTLLAALALWWLIISALPIGS